MAEQARKAQMELNALNIAADKAKKSLDLAQQDLDRALSIAQQQRLVYESAKRADDVGKKG